MEEFFNKHEGGGIFYNKKGEKGLFAQITGFFFRGGC